MHLVLLTVDFGVRTSGGIGAYVHTLATTLTRRGHAVTVISPKVDGRDDASYDLVRIANVAASTDRRLELARVFRSAVLDLHERRPVDVVEATDYGLEGFACLADESTAAAGIVTVVRLHTPDSMVCELNAEIRLLDSPTVHDHEAQYFHRARHLSSPSLAMRRQACRRWELSPERITLLANPVFVAPIVEAPPGAPFRLAFFGRLERRKGAEVLVDALLEVLPRRPELEVEFVGADTRTSAGSYGRRLRDRLAEYGARVRFTGHLDGADRRRVLSSAHAVCTPSLWENSPYACLEALAGGRPVIATSGSGFDELITPGVEGLLVPPGDATALAAAIELLVDGELRPAAEAIRESVSRFAADQLACRFEAYYAGLRA